MAPFGVLAAVLALAGCASDDHPPRGRRSWRRAIRRVPAGPPQRASLFVSPAGEPFRAGPGEPYPVAVWFRLADADGDGKLTRDEFVADAARFFSGSTPIMTG
ncbi:MAG: EF-hand domain-containing protein, partial [Caulobacteraceae bacterium]